jgi:hypothetical protein
MSNSFAANKLRIVRNKSTATIALVLMLTMAATLITCLPTVNAVAVQINTFLDVMASPNPVGVGQTVLVTFQLDKVSPNAIGVSGGTHFTGFTVEITKPDGTTYTTPSMTATAISGNYFLYVPDTVGTYELKAIFLGQWINVTGYEFWYRPSTSGILELTVQQEPIPDWPTVPLPTDYWTRPIYGENKEWWQVSDDWLMKGYDIMTRPFPGSPAFSPYTSAPNSAHIMWTKPLWFGGIVGGPYGDKTYYMGLSYEQPYEPIIINGRIIYAEHGPTNSFQYYGTHCIDMYTGKEIWYKNGTRIDFAQNFAWESPNEHGILPYLWSYDTVGLGASARTTLKMYDANTGNYILTINNVPFGLGQSMYWGPAIFGPSGEILSYSIDTTHNTLMLWNSTRAILYNPSAPPLYGLDAATWSPTIGSVINGSRGIQWNVTIPATPAVAPGVWMINDQKDIMLAGFADLTRRDRPVYTHIAYKLSSIKSEVEELWRENRTNIECMYLRLSRNIRDGVYTQYDEAAKVFHGYSITDGQELWETDPLPAGWSIFTRNYMIAYGKLLTVGYDGMVRAFDIENGDLLWDVYYGSAGYETHYGSWPTYAGPVVADHKMYTTNDDHSPDSIPWRGGKLWVFNTETGEGLWNISGWFRIPAIADGYLTATNSLDGQIYVFGKGPSATTISVSPAVVANGSSVLIQGTVTDKSPGQADTPCVSKESMSAWMEYLHMQKPMPTSVTGVPVQLLAVKEDGSMVEIGTVTSDTGGFRYAWTPPDEGLYTITANFAGDESYGSSYATTGLSVGPAPPEPTVPEPVEIPAYPDYTPMFAGIIAAVAVAIIIGIVSLLDHRRLRK